MFFFNDLYVDVPASWIFLLSLKPTDQLGAGYWCDRYLAMALGWVHIFFFLSLISILLLLLYS